MLTISNSQAIEVQASTTRMAETASWKKKVKEYQCYLTLKAYLAVTEQKENNKENLNGSTLLGKVNKPNKSNFIGMTCLP